MCISVPQIYIVKKKGRVKNNFDFLGELTDKNSKCLKYEILIIDEIEKIEIVYCSCFVFLAVIKSKFVVNTLLKKRNLFFFYQIEKEFNFE